MTFEQRTPKPRIGRGSGGNEQKVETAVKITREKEPEETEKQEEHERLNTRGTQSTRHETPDIKKNHLRKVHLFRMDG